jgi:rhodanese-related sulfurtransferase
MTAQQFGPRRSKFLRTPIFWFGHPSWLEEVFMPEAPRITADEVKQRTEAGEEDFVVIDVRNPQAWAESEVKARNAIHVPLDSLEQYLPRIPKSKAIVIYCT